MKNSLIFKSLASLPLIAALLTACVDDNYDLANINTDVEIKVNDLVVPINLDAITLSNAIEEGDVVKVVNGEYAVVVDGSFHSEAIKVKALTVNPGSVNNIDCTIYKYDGMPGAPSIPVSGKTVAYEITEATTPFSFGSQSVDSSIRSLSNIKGSWDITLKLNLTDLNNAFEHLEFQKLVLNLPAGMHVANYPCSDGKVDLGTVPVSAGKPSIVTLNVDEIDFTKFSANDFKFVAGDKDANNGVIEFNGKVGVNSGFVVAALNAITPVEPQLVKLIIEPQLNTINVNSIKGNIEYSIDGFKAADVMLDDVPDMLRQKGTDVMLANPQLYLSINNPMANYGLTASSGLTLTAYKDNNPVINCPLNEGQLIRIKSDKGVTGPYNFCLSPNKPSAFYEGFAGADWVGFNSLSDLLSGDGLPDYVHVEFNAPTAGPDDVPDFPVGHTFDPVEGNYTLYAPLELKPNSVIVYQEDETDWDDESIQRITISKLSVKATITNNLPAEIKLTGAPLTVGGTPCINPNTNEEVKFKEVTVDAGATTEIELIATGIITRLDGIRYTATCTVTKAGQVLTPDTPIEITNIRATVSGSYRDTL